MNDTYSNDLGMILLSAVIKRKRKTVIFLTAVNQENRV